VVGDQNAVRDLAMLPVALVGSLRATGDPWEPYRIVDAAGEPMAAVAAAAASGCASPSTGPGPATSPPPSPGCRPYHPADQPGRHYA